MLKHFAPQKLGLLHKQRSREAQGTAAFQGPKIAES